MLHGRGTQTSLVCHQHPGGSEVAVAAAAAAVAVHECTEVCRFVCLAQPGARGLAQGCPCDEVAVGPSPSFPCADTPAHAHGYGGACETGRAHHGDGRARGTSLARRGEGSRGSEGCARRGESGGRLSARGTGCDHRGEDSQESPRDVWST